MLVDIDMLGNVSPAQKAKTFAHRDRVVVFSCVFGAKALFGVIAPPTPQRYITCGVVVAYCCREMFPFLFITF
jgi:hypothetical protein